MRFGNNYNQGILVVEGCSAIITDNIVAQNLKANIAFGGQGSKNTRVEGNEVSGSVAEGIFVVEGQENTLVRNNKVTQNKDGIVLYNSEGKIRENNVFVSCYQLFFIAKSAFRYTLRRTDYC